MSSELSQAMAGMNLKNEQIVEIVEEFMFVSLGIVPIKNKENKRIRK